MSHKCRLIVLNDGETYTDAKGCMLIEVDDGVMKRIEDGDKIHWLLKTDFTIIARF